MNLKQKNADIGLIYDLLESKNIGEVVTYQQIQSICVKTRNILTDRSAMQSAIRKLRNAGIIYHNVLNVGYKRVTAEEIVTKTPDYLKRSNKVLKTANKELDTVNENEIPNNLRVKKLAYQAITSTIIHLSKPKQVGTMLQKAMNNELPELPEKLISQLN